MKVVSKDLLREKASRIRFVLFDVDGTLTDGQIIFGPDGEDYKSFNIKDGMGIHLAQKDGIRIGLISGRRSLAVEKRANDLEILHVWQDIKDKGGLLKCILKDLDLKPEEVAFMGDDINDLGILREVGLSAAVANAVREVKDIADFISELDGGRGAAREFIDFIRSAKTRLKTQNV
ncbi:HAD-IIIA family hydrolase [bacterium]|nr:HAD-IIIA family hydrolase [bacterium]